MNLVWENLFISLFFFFCKHYVYSKTCKYIQICSNKNRNLIQFVMHLWNLFHQSTCINLSYIDALSATSVLQQFNLNIHHHFSKLTKCSSRADFYASVCKVKFLVSLLLADHSSGNFPHPSVHAKMRLTNAAAASIAMIRISCQLKSCASSHSLRTGFVQLR